MQAHHHTPRLAALLITACLAGAVATASAQPAPTAPASGALPPNPAASAGGISDAVARCEAKTSALERRECRRQLAQQAPAKR